MVVVVREHGAHACLARLEAQLEQPQPQLRQRRLVALDLLALVLKQRSQHAAEAAPAEIPPFAKLDVRVGRIVEAWEHPDSDKLWCEKIDVGEEEPREIASGLRAYYATKEDMEGRAVLVVCNLKEAKLAGFKSNGMVLCASSEDKSTVAFVEPPADSKPGERVVCEGMMVEPASPNQVKKKKLMEGAAAQAKALRAMWAKNVDLKAQQYDVSLARLTQQAKEAAVAAEVPLPETPIETPQGSERSARV